MAGLCRAVYFQDHTLGTCGEKQCLLSPAVGKKVFHGGSLVIYLLSPENIYSGSIVFLEPSL